MKSGLTIIAIWLVFAGFAQGQVSIRTEVEGDRFFVGEAFTFYLVVEGEEPAEEPDFRQSDDLTVRLTGSHSTELDGKTVATYTYRAVPLRGGTIELPGGVVTTGGATYTGTAKSLEAAVPKGTEQLRLTLSLSKSRCYIGEPVVLSFAWESELSLSGMRAVDIRLPVLADERFEVFESLDRVDPTSSDAIGLPVSHSRVIARLATGDQTDGESGRPARLVFEKVIVPRETGDLKLGAAKLLCSYLSPAEKKFGGFRYPSYFNNDFFDQTVKGDYQRYLVSSNELSLSVEDLPRDGRPGNFDGIIGGITLATDVSPKVAQVDDPMNLTISVGNHPFPQTLRIPSLAEQESLTYSFTVSDEDRGSSIREGKAIFRRLIRPERANIHAVPALRLSFFDPVTGDYGQAESKPMPIRVTRAETVSAFDAVFADGERLRNSVRVSKGGIFENFSKGVIIADVKTGSRPRWEGFLGVLLLFGPPLLVLAIAMLTKDWRLERRDPMAARARQAYSRFRAQVSGVDVSNTSVETMAQLKASVQQYFGDRFGVIPETIDGEDVRRMLGGRSLDPRLGAGLQEFWEKCDAREYSEVGVNGDGVESICRAIPGLIAQVEGGLET
ncbi:MAG: hypothetical protein AAGA96_00740 [Verrucomicrobiota bacterium]